MATLENKVALVTGATSGIGRAAALALGTAGAKVVFSGRREREGEVTAALIRNAGAECLFVCSDVSSEEDVKQRKSLKLSFFYALMLPDTLLDNL